jgi:hypothetical protein
VKSGRCHSNNAAEAAIRSPADGYTLFLAGAVNAVNATLYEKLSFNFANELHRSPVQFSFPRS